MSHLFCPHAVATWSLRCGRRAKRLAMAAGLYGKSHADQGKEDVFKKKTGNACQLLITCQQKCWFIALNRPGGHGGAAAPVPIPNTAVKRPSANGTSSQDAGE